MAVKISENYLRVAVMTFEARFDDGYRYLDQCGALISQIRKHDPKWKVNDANPQMGALTHNSKSLSCVIDTTKLVISRKAGEPVLKEKGDVVVRDLAAESAIIYSYVIEQLEIPNTIRVGARFSFIATADSVEEANGFIVRRNKSDFLQEAERLTSSNVYAAQLRYSVEDSTTGIRRNIMVGSVHAEEPEQPITGLGGEEDKLRSGIAVDIDTFTRPTTGHFSDPATYISTCYTRSLRQSHDLLLWLGDRTRH